MNRLLNEPEMIPADLSIQEFENLLDIMLYFVIDSVDTATANIASGDSVKLQLSGKAFEVLTALTCQKFDCDFAAEDVFNNPNSPPLGNRSECSWPNVGRMLDAVSKTTPPITVREKVIRAVLHTYSPNVPQQH
jgi:hypothetical protein